MLSNHDSLVPKKLKPLKPPPVIMPEAEMTASSFGDCTFYEKQLPIGGNIQIKRVKPMLKINDISLDSSDDSLKVANFVGKFKSKKVRDSLRVSLTSMKPRYK